MTALGRQEQGFRFPQVALIHQLDCCATSYIVTTIRTFKDNGLCSTCLEGHEGNLISDRQRRAQRTVITNILLKTEARI